jgi:hypothetical protein
VLFWRVDDTLPYSSPCQLPRSGLATGGCGGAWRQGPGISRTFRSTSEGAADSRDAKAVRCATRSEPATNRNFLRNGKVRQNLTEQTGLVHLVQLQPTGLAELDRSELHFPHPSPVPRCGGSTARAASRTDERRRGGLATFQTRRFSFVPFRRSNCTCPTGTPTEGRLLLFGSPLLNGRCCRARRRSENTFTSPHRTSL